MDLVALAERYAAISRDEEEKILRAIFAGGWEAGCWLRADPARVLNNSRADIDGFLDTMKTRESLFLNYGEDPNPHGLAHTPVDGSDPCFVVVGQRCDLIAQFRTEPLIELAPARFTANKGDIKSRWKTSPREFPLDPESDETFMVDIRQRYWLPKIDLLDYEPLQGLPADSPPTLPRFRFGLRLGQRYTRTALPDDLALGVFSPLAEILEADTDADRLFKEWMIYHGERWPEDRPFLIGVYAVPDLNDLPDEVQELAAWRFQQAAEDKFNRVAKELTERSPGAEDLIALDDKPSGTIDDAELPHPIWRSSWKLDLDAGTFAGESHSALPDR